MTRDEVFTLLRQHGIAKVLVEFSGGNDEGGADNINFLDANGNRVAAPPSVEKLDDALEAPIYQCWGGFAGEFEVSGTLTWDVAAREVSQVYSQTEWVDQDREVI